LRSRAALQAENLALRHQIGVLQRRRKQLHLNSADRFFWVWLLSFVGSIRGEEQQFFHFIYINC
jgi:hypothetical protein